MKRVDAVADGEAPPDAIPTGFPSLDRLLGGGARRGDLIVLGGDVGAGKSAFALAVALRARRAGAIVEFMTGEMDQPRVLERVLALEGKVSVDNLRQGTMDETTRAAVGAAVVRLRDVLPRISRLAAGGPDALAEQLARLDDAALVVIDSLQSIPAGASSQDEEMAQAVRRIKAFAVDAGTAVLLTAHLPSFDREREDLRPTLEDFGVFGAVKHHADAVLGLFREELYQAGPGQEGATELAVLKNRNGPVSYVDLYFYRQWLRFEDMVEPGR